LNLDILFLNIISSIPELISDSVKDNPNVAYLVICFAMFLENLIPPIPSEIIMPLGGFFVYQGNLNFYILVVFGLIGTVIGALPWYYLGRFLNEKKIASFVENKGKFLGISSKDLEKSKLWFDKYGVSLVFWGRLIPGIRTLISVPAGIELMPLKKFLVWTTLGSLIWVVLLSTSGYVFGENYRIIESYVDNFKIFIKPFLIIVLIFFIFKYLKNIKVEA
tara:strand:+ start:408 stop:1067 length:660 start_codon:yes stop_codon:yes gene_type:complete